MQANFSERVLPALYRSAEQPESWCLALDQVRDAMGARCAVVQMLQRQGDRLLPLWNVRDSLSAAHAELHDRLVNNDRNPRLTLDAHRLPLAESSVLHDNRRLASRQPQYKAFYERLRKAGLGRSILLGLHYEGDRYLSLIVHRASDDARLFTQEHECMLQSLEPHLKQSVSLAEKLGQLHGQSEMLGRVVDQLAIGAVIATGKGRIHWANRCALQMLECSPCLKVAGGQLHCRAARDSQSLGHLLDVAATSPPGTGRAVGTLGELSGAPLQILAQAVGQAHSRSHPHPHSGGEPLVVLYLSERGGVLDIPAPDIAGLFGLTPAEARLAVALGSGASLNEYADGQGLSVGTARIQLKSIFSKLGVNRQPELVRLLCSSVAAKCESPWEGELARSRVPVVRCGTGPGGGARQAE